MILRGTTPRALTWVGTLAVLGLAALLPLMPTWAQDTKPQPPPPGRSQKENQPGAKEVTERARHEQLKKIENAIRELHEQMEKQRRDMETKLRELQEARRKLLGQEHKPGEKAPPHRPFPGDFPKPPQPPTPPDFKPSQGPFGGPGTDVQRRLAEMERKLDELMREIRELRSHKPAGPGSGFKPGPRGDKKDRPEPSRGPVGPNDPEDPARCVRPVPPAPGNPLAPPEGFRPEDHPIHFPPFDPTNRPVR